jgi:chromosomal replication initiator protein
MWLRPINCKSIDGQRITLSAPSKWIKEWFQDNYQSIVLDALRAQTNQEFEILFEVPEPLVETRHDETPLPSLARPAEKPAADAASDLLVKYTFEAFVVGPSNQLAHAAARAVAEVPAGKYNPLFIYGGVGLGKTHLVHAIGHRLRGLHPQWRILYLKTEAFINEFITCVRNGKIDEFRTKYRERCDALLMDDIQFLAGKDRTQEEFFHTFNSLFEGHKQIVLTADKYPHEIPDLEDRLRSRFQNGLIADIQPPELETRIAILKKKAELDDIPLPDDVAVYLATNIKSNVRELEGLLLRVAAFAGLQEQSITIEFAKGTLKNFLTQAAHSLTVEAVQKEVANYFNVKLADLKSPKRHQAIARPRQIAMYLARKLCKASYPELGQRFGGKDHTTVLSACRKIDKLVAEDAKTRHTVEELERHLSHT